MLFKVPALLVAGLLLVSQGSAQEAGHGPELGVRGGLSFLFREGFTASIVGIPGPTLQGPQTVYATFFIGETFAVEPQVGFVSARSSGSTRSQVAIAGQLMQFTNAVTESRGSTYAFLNGGLLHFSSARSNTSYQAGGGVGYRWVVRRSLGLRFEGRYRRYFSRAIAGPNEFSLLIGAGAVLAREP